MKGWSGIETGLFRIVHGELSAYRGVMAQLVDWDLAAATAATLSKSGPRVTYAEAAEVVSQLRELTDVAEGHVRGFTRLTARVEHPPVRVVDRPDWAAVNVEGLSSVLGPLMERLVEGREPSAMAQAVGSRVTGVQAGTVLAYLSGKVLGQYEVFASDPGQLLLVAPNIVEVERRLQADPRDFRLWVCLHEVTHRVQFTAVPWMRERFFSEVGAFIEAAQLDSEQLIDRLRRAIEAIARSIKEPNQSFNILELVQTPAQREIVDRLTAMMTLLEGHAEFVMDGVGPEVVPSVEEIRSKFNRRREAASPIERVIRKLLGIDVKLRQYAEGRKFVQAVVERAGMDGFNQVWTSPETLPRREELSDADLWIERVLGRTFPAGDNGARPPRTADAVTATTEVVTAPVEAEPATDTEAPGTPAEAAAAEQASAKEATGTKAAGTEPAGTEPAGTEPARTEAAAAEGAVAEDAEKPARTPAKRSARKSPTKAVKKTAKKAVKKAVKKAATRTAKQASSAERDPAASTDATSGDTPSSAASTSAAARTSGKAAKPTRGKRQADDGDPTRRIKPRRKAAGSPPESPNPTTE